MSPASSNPRTLSSDIPCSPATTSGVSPSEVALRGDDASGSIEVRLQQAGRRLRLAGHGVEGR